jgi:P-type conjugative transfer protein TrbJ
MKTRALAGLVAAALAAGSPPALAGGGGFAGATEVTQLVNMGQLVMQYAMQAQQYVTQLQQTQTMLTNLMRNPLGVITPDLAKLANDTARLIQTGRDIGSSITQVDQNFSQMFDSTQAANFADKFRMWTEGSTDGLKHAMRAAGMQREQFADDATAVQALVENLSSAEGNLAALQALGGINAKQIEEGMKLRDLIATQQQATSQYLVAQAKKEQEIDDMNRRLWQFENKPLPAPRPKNPGQF